MWTRRRFLKTLGTIPLAGVVQSVQLPILEQAPEAADDGISFSDGGSTSFGNWRADIRFSPVAWRPGATLDLEVFLHLSPALIQALASGGYPIDAVLMLVTSERCFDPDGWLRLPSDDRMSTLITPTGLAIEGGNVGAISKSVGARHRNPVDQLKRLPASELQQSPDSRWVRFALQSALPNDTPPGIYRLRFDFGIVSNKRSVSLSAEGFAYRPRDLKERSLIYTQPILCSGPGVNGAEVDAAKISPRIYWTLLSGYNSNGYRGVVADEDRGHFAISDRNIIPDEVILPLGTTYSLEPELRADTYDEQRNIPWNYSSGELSIQVTDPTGKTVDLGTLPYTGEKNGRPTTGNTRFTGWKPALYGQYTVVAKGWIADRWGNHYQGGGTYHFWIAKRLTMATATFQGQSYPVGSKYGRDMAFAPAVPADVTVKVDLYPDSDPARVKTLHYSGKASPGGIFGAAQGVQSFALDSAGEYHAHVLATYTDAEKTLWVSSMRHAGVVYPSDTTLIAHGKKLKIHDTNQLVDRGDSHYEGYVESDGDLRHLDHIDFPYNAGDVLLIASEGDGANKIEPVITYEIANSGQEDDPKIQPIGATNVRIATSNGMSPHMYPEYITDLAYYYGAGPRPGFMSRFLVGEDGVRGPYWPTSSTNFGGQIGASNNGDIPGTPYRLLGGVVLRKKDQAPMYGGYVATAFIMPKGTNNNRVIAAGSEDLTGADGQKFRFFLVSLRPGMIYEEGTSFAPGFQIDPILPVHINCKLWRDGQVVKEWDGTGDASGSFAGADKVALDKPGLYSYTVQSDWQGNPGHVPGLPDDGGYIYVIEKSRPAGPSGLKLGLKSQQSFKIEDGLVIPGVSTGDKVYFAAVTPGAVVDQGVLPVEGGKFQYKFDPAAVHQRIPIYDVENVRSGKRETGRVVHLTFFSQEKGADGSSYHAFARVIFRGTTAIYTA
jgi:hypothetical protein